MISILAACGGGKPGSGGQPDAGNARTVSSTLQTLYRADDGTSTTRPGWDARIANGATVTGLLVTDAADPSGYQTLPVSVAADGTFSVSNVPAGSYFIQVDIPSFAAANEDPNTGNFTTVKTVDRVLYEATGSAPDLTIVTALRPDVQTIPASDATKVQVHFAGLSPFDGAHDSLVFFSAQNGLDSFYDPSVFTPALADGATGVDGSIVWQDRSGGVLPDASKGDVEWYWQSRNDLPVANGGFLSKAVAFAKVGNLTVADGSSGNSLSATFAAAPQTGTLPADIRFSQFSALASSVAPGSKGSEFTQPFLKVVSVPHALTFPDQPMGSLNAGSLRIDDSFGDGAVLVPEISTQTLNLTPPFREPTADLDFGSIAYPQMFDSHQAEAVQFIYFYDVPVQFDAATRVAVQGSGYYRAFLPRAQLPNPLVPQLGPPTAPQINGSDAFTFPVSGHAGAQPVISWSAPALGTASKYLLMVAPEGGNAKAGDIGTLTVVLHDQTSFKLPAYIDSTRHYYGIITAVNSPDRLDDPIFALGSPRLEVTTVFGEFQR